MKTLVVVRNLGCAYVYLRVRSGFLQVSVIVDGSCDRRSSFPVIHVWVTSTAGTPCPINTSASTFYGLFFCSDEGARPGVWSNRGSRQRPTSSTISSNTANHGNDGILHDTVTGPSTMHVSIATAVSKEQGIQVPTKPSSAILWECRPSNLPRQQQKEAHHGYSTTPQTPLPQPAHPRTFRGPASSQRPSWPFWPWPSFSRPGWPCWGERTCLRWTWYCLFLPYNAQPFRLGSGYTRTSESTGLD